MEKNTLSRPPIVVVLGHVDHGKTSLLDAIRKTNVVAKEVGGITQSIGASEIITPSGKRITFIDTPGHAAFFGMRKRGAKLADIALLVVSADDGIKPQTREAIEHIRKSDIPFIVVITKMDLASADLQGVLGQLEKEGISLEKRGGNVPWVEVSAKNQKGINELLELISLVFEMSGPQSDKDSPLEAVVIETGKGKGGCTASIVVRSGSLKVGDTVYCQNITGKVKSLLGGGGLVKEVFPGEAAQILGFSEVLPVGSLILSTLGLSQNKMEENKLFGEGVTVGEKDIPIFLKAGNAGMLEAVLGGIPEGVVVISSGVGDIFESDILTAKASGADIFSFEVKTSPQVKKLAEAEGVTIYNFKIIYELFDKLKEILEKGKVEVLGKAEIIASFPFNGKKIAGCKVIQGRITKGDNLILMQGEKEIGKIKPLSLKKQKQEITEARQGEEFGLFFTPQLDFTMGDVILAVRK